MVPFGIRACFIPRAPFPLFYHIFYHLGELNQRFLKYQVSYQQVRTCTLRFEEMGEAGLEDRRGRRRKD